MMVFYPGEELCEGMVEHCKHHAWLEEKNIEKELQRLEHELKNLMHEIDKVEHMKVKNKGEEEKKDEGNKRSKT